MSKNKSFYTTGMKNRDLKVPMSNHVANAPVPKKRRNQEVFRGITVRSGECWMHLWWDGMFWNMDNHCSVFRRGDKETILHDTGKYMGWGTSMRDHVRKEMTEIQEHGNS
jgi:hypothetical protein